MSPEDAFNELLTKAREGDREAKAKLLPIVYDELRDLARMMMRAERGNHTLQPTAVVNEACLRLISADSPLDYHNRLHFVRLAAREMRRVLIEHARARGRDKRGGAYEHVSVIGCTVTVEDNMVDLLALEDALTQLASIDPVKADIVEMRYFGGMTNSEVADTLGVTQRTIERKWNVARRRLAILIDGEPQVDQDGTTNE